VWGIASNKADALGYNYFMNNPKILGYKDLVNVATHDNSEPLVDVRTYDSTIIAQYDKHDMQEYTGNIILVRDTLAQKLARVNAALVTVHSAHLKVVYGYRHPKIQEQYFAARKVALKKRNPNLTEDALNELTHNFVAVPSIAGHPAGAAVDVTIMQERGSKYDMGTAIADYSAPRKIQTFASGLTTKQATHRILHDFMIKEGFAPFYGEWWHFSFGDREWTVFYSKDSTLYDTIDFRLKP
jgi:D-alanyl-D-alanine dipeptidase